MTRGKLPEPSCPQDCPEVICSAIPGAVKHAWALRQMQSLQIACTVQCVLTWTASKQQHRQIFTPEGGCVRLLRWKTSQDIWQLIQDCLVACPEGRPTAKEVRSRAQNLNRLTSLLLAPAVARTNCVTSNARSTASSMRLCPLLQCFARIQSSCNSLNLLAAKSWGYPASYDGIHASSQVLWEHK